MQALILAGGAGTRLRSVLGDTLNKPMARVAGKPFLEYLIVRLQQQHIDSIILCVGYRADLIESYFGSGERWGVQLTYSRESAPLGTGGAVKLAADRAADLAREDEFLVLNGDSFFDVDLSELERFHHEMGASATLALARVEKAARYGGVCLDDAQRIVGFAEKEHEPSVGLINGGIYIFARAVLDMIASGQACSLEREVFPALAAARSLYGRPVAGYFIDIGVPADYERLCADPSPLLASAGRRR